MDKKISQSNIDLVMKILLQLNIPIQAYFSVKDLFDKLPIVKEVVEPKK